MSDHTTVPSTSRPPEVLGRRADGGDQVTRILIWAIGIVVIAVLGVLAYALYQVPRYSNVPQTDVERRMFVLEALTKSQQTNPRVWADYAAVLIQSQQYILAGQVIDRGLASTKNDPSVMFEKAQLLKAQGQDQEALSQIDRTIAAAKKARQAQIAALAAKGVEPPKPPESEPIVNSEILRATIMEQLLRWKDAVKAYTAALKERPDMSDVFVARAAIYLKLRQFDKARSDYQAALKMIPDYQPALQGLQTLKKETGK